jgi:hypothetical protein
MGKGVGDNISLKEGTRVSKIDPKEFYPSSVSLKPGWTSLSTTGSLERLTTALVSACLSEEKNFDVQW